MQKCILDGYTYLYNPPENQNPAVKAVSITDTLMGRVYTIYGTDASRRDIVQKWPTMDTAFFAALEAKSMLLEPLSYTDENGTVYTVIANPPTYNNTTPGGLAYINVQFTMNVVSSP